MTTRKLMLCLPATFLVVLFTAAAAQAQGRVYDFRDVKAPNAIQTDTYAVNRNAIIAGDYVDVHGIQHGMIFNVATHRLTTLPNTLGCQTLSNTPGSIAAFGINNSGTVAGWCINATTGLRIAFTFANGRYTNIAFPGATGTEANGINDNGEVVGTYSDQTGQHGFYLIGSTYTKVDAPHASATTAWGVTNAGVITLFGKNSSGTFVSFTFDGKITFKRFSVPGAGPMGTLIQTPNNNGDIVFTWYDANNLAHGAWFHKGVYIKFNDSTTGAINTRGNGLSDALVSGPFKGQVEIVGRYSIGAMDFPSTAPNVGYSAIGCCR
jgi:hypothetical protein